MKKIFGLSLCVCAALGIFVKLDYDKFCQSGGFVLEYHGVGFEPWGKTLVMTPEIFESHLQYLQDKGYKMVTVKELMGDLRAGNDVSRKIALSFDDGYKNNYTYALPLMKKYGAHGTFHIINNRIGTDTIYMNEGEIHAMLAAGMEIGSHTFSHNPLGDIEEKYYDWETGVSKYDLERRFPGLIVETMAYPNGSYNPKIIAKLKEHGFKQGLTGSLYLVDKKMVENNPMETARVIIEDDGSQPGRFPWLIQRAYKKSYLRARGIDVGD
ncbi:MAG: polysaccharide deacetylase family protein [Phascolarctobacterium sp.]|nr:polysaccharide deacetylase family protein [Phascolarctobacterium sp.]